MPLKTWISEREEELPVLTVGKFLKIAEEDKKIISLGPGEPDFPAPPHVIQAAKRALTKKQTHYSPIEGRSSLLEEISKKLKKDNKIFVNPDQVFVTTGSNEALFLGLMATTDPGEGVLLPDPGFLAFKPQVEALTGNPIAVPHLEEDSFQLNPDILHDVHIPKKTNVLIINSPSNPTGIVYTKKILESIAQFAIEHDLLIFSDEAYEKLVYDKAKHISIASLNGMSQRVVTFQSFSKTLAMPGFRIGYATGPEQIIQAMRKLHTLTSLASPTIGQIAATEALKQRAKTKQAIGKMRNEYNRRRKLVLKRLKEMGLPCVEPKGAFYAFPSVRHLLRAAGKIKNSYDFSMAALERGKVAVIPGTEFGRHGEGYIRISYATNYKLLEKGLDRLEKVVK